MVAAGQTGSSSFSLTLATATASTGLASLGRVCCVGKVGTTGASCFAAGAVVAEASVLAAAWKAAAAQIFDAKA